MTELFRTICVGPFPVMFGNVNDAMNLRGHYHHAEVRLVYSTTVRHGYPAFKATNDAIRTKLQELTKGIFREATNEDVTDRLFAALDGWTDPSWEPYGGEYQLHAVMLDVFGVWDDIGHDAGFARYTTARKV